MTSSTPPIYPLATRDDLLDDLAMTELAIERLGQGLVVDREQLESRKKRLEWWRDRVVAQLAEMDGEWNVGCLIVGAALVGLWTAFLVVIAFFGGLI